MPTPTLEVDRYFARIGYRGSREATLGTLTALHEHHVRAIPFENLDVLLGRGVQIDLASVEQKIVAAGRGGYCYEQNGLFAAALRALGFRVEQLIARVRWQIPPEVDTGLTHMVLRVETADAGLCIADVGFGSMSLERPLRLQFDVEQPGALEPRRLVQQNGQVVQQAKLGQTWADIYRFTLDDRPMIDFELANWFNSTHPRSHFLHNLIASRGAEGCRHTLLNRELATRFAGGRVEKRTIESGDELLAVLASHFGLHFPPGTRFGQPGAAWPV